MIEKNQNRLLKCELKIQREIDEIQAKTNKKLRLTNEKEAEFNVQRLNSGLFDLRLLSRIVLHLLTIDFDAPTFAAVDSTLIGQIVRYFALIC